MSHYFVLYAVYYYIFSGTIAAIIYFMTNSLINHYNGLGSSLLADFFNTNDLYSYDSGYKFKENQNDYSITIPVPGLSKKDVSAQVIDNILSVKAEKKTEGYDFYFNKNFSIYSDMDTSCVAAKVKDGLLTFNIPKREKNKKAIDIK